MPDLNAAYALCIVTDALSCINGEIRCELGAGLGYCTAGTCHCDAGNNVTINLSSVPNCSHFAGWPL